jgi:flagellar basal body rod protein FlgG
VNRALYASATGMAAQQQNLDVIADNLANADVMGFKNAQATFAQIGGDAFLGTAATGVRHVFSQGKLVRSSSVRAKRHTRGPARSHGPPTVRCATPTAGRCTAFASRRPRLA